MNGLRGELIGRIRSFKYAFEGWWYVLRTQRNAWIHAVASVCVFALGFLLRITLVEWGLIILAVMMVWMGEFMNTAVETVVDMISPDHHPLAKVAKDVAAAAVLIAAGGSILIGLFVFGPPLYDLLLAG